MVLASLIRMARLTRIPAHRIQRFVYTFRDFAHTHTHFSYLFTLQLFLESMESLNLPITEFLGRIYKDKVDVNAPLVCVKPSSTLEEVLGKMTVARVHRVFVVDDDSMPLAVVSVTDIMKLIASVSF